MTPQHIVTLPYGHLPTRSYFTIHSGLPVSEARATLDGMRAEMRRHGPNDVVRATLLLCGFAWTAAPSIDEDVAAVRDALGVTMHDGTHPDCAACAMNRRMERAS